MTAISLSSYPESFTTSRGRQVENLIVQNEGVWSGVKKADDTFQLSPDSLVSISATFDGNRGIITKKPSGYINGSIKYGYGRLTTDSGILGTNAMLIDGMFAEDMTEIKLHLHLWLANCQPTVEAYVRCMPGIEQPSPNYLQLGSKFGLLGNLEGADLCNAITADKPSRMCHASGELEFPTFNCDVSPLPDPSNVQAVAQRLKFRWQDAKGSDIGNQPDTFVTYMPTFPIRLTVENEWGRSITAIVADAPQGGSCPAPR